MGNTNHKELSADIIKTLHKGVVIPAMPLALNQNRKLDDRRQRALIRYYLDAGVGGLAVAVHTTQFEIRNPEINLFEPVLRIAKEEFDSFADREDRPVIRIAGVIGQTAQATREASLALSHGYHACLLSLAAFPEASNQTIMEHCRAVADIIPVIGFYLQPAVGGRVLDVDFWREFAQIENVIAIKMAPFNRYQTIDVVRGVIESGRAEKIALYSKKLAKKNTVVGMHAELAHLSELALTILHDSLDAFARMDAEQAVKILGSDQQVNVEFDNLSRLLITFMMEDTRHIKGALRVNWCGRSLERIAEHAQNICEYVIFLVKGKDIRHTSLEHIRSKYFPHDFDPELATDSASENLDDNTQA